MNNSVLALRTHPAQAMSDYGILEKLPLEYAQEMIQELETTEKLQLCSELQVNKDWCADNVGSIFSDDDYMEIGHLLATRISDMSYEMFEFIFSFSNHILQTRVINSYYFRENPNFARELVEKLLEGEMGHPTLDIGEWLSVHASLFPKNILGNLTIEFLGMERSDAIEELRGYYPVPKVLSIPRLYELDNFDRIVEVIGEYFTLSFTPTNVKTYITNAVRAGKEEFIIQILNIDGEITEIALEELSKALPKGLLSDDLVEYIVNKFGSGRSTPTFEDERDGGDEDDIDFITRRMGGLGL